MNDDTSLRSYEPTDIVVNTHRLPHLTYYLQQRSNKFDISYDDTNNSYSQSLLILPSILGSIAILAVLVFNIYLCSRSNCNCNCNCYTSKNSTTSYTKKCLSTCHKILIFFAICLFGLLLADQNALLGERLISESLQKMHSGLNKLNDKFEVLEDDGMNLQDDGDSLLLQLGDATETGCIEASSVGAFVSRYQNHISDYQDETDSVWQVLSGVEDNVDEYRITDIGDSVWGLHFLVLAAALFVSVGVFTENHYVINSSIMFTDIVLLIAFIAVTAIMVTMMGISDFCVDPMNNLRNLSPANAFDPITFYSTCQGTNPLKQKIYEAQNESNIAMQEVYDLLDGSCADNEALIQSLAQFESIDATITNIYDIASCKPLLRTLESIVNSDLCTIFFRGFYIIWIGLYISAVFLFGLIILASCKYQQSLYRKTISESDDIEDIEDIEIGTIDPSEFHDYFFEEKEESDDDDEVKEDEYSEDDTVKEIDKVVVEARPRWSDISSDVAVRYPPAAITDVDELSSDFRPISCMPDMTPVHLKISPHPFKKGIKKSVYYTKSISSPSDDVVLKASMATSARHQTCEKYEQFLTCHVAAHYFSEEFNRRKPAGCPSICYVRASIMQIQSRPSRPFYIEEETIKGEFEKYNNNNGMCREQPTSIGTDHRAVQAFSHWTYEHSSHRMMVVDCQGFYDRGSQSFVLTDPAVHSELSLKTEFGGANQRRFGMEQFFRTHRCNEYCQALHLPKCS